MVKLSGSIKKSNYTGSIKTRRTTKSISAPASLETKATEAKILAAARTEFIAKGKAGARMHAIAINAGVNKALLHYYFRSKDKLYAAALKDILQSVWTKMRQEVLAQGPAKDLESLVHTWVSTYIRTLASNPDFPLFLFHEISSGGETLEPIAHEILKEFGEVPAMLLRTLQADIAAGKIRPIANLHFFLNIAGMCVVTFLAMPLLRKLGSRLGSPIELNEEFIDTRIEAITSMIFHGLRNKK
jgi:TetR/AcrR family transcriptional regulator